MSNHSQIDLVIPVLNPGAGWVSETLERKTILAEKSGLGIRLLVVNDGSSSTAVFNQLTASDPQAKIIHLDRNYGKGCALRAGIDSASSDIILFTDADFPYSLDSMVDVIKAVVAGANVVLGYREQDYYASVPWFRKGMSEWFRFVLKRILRFPITDTQCGLKGMDLKGKDVFLCTTVNRFLVDMEFIKLAVRESNLSIEPVVVKLRNDVTFSRMGLAVIIREGLNFLKILVK